MMFSDLGENLILNEETRNQLIQKVRSDVKYKGSNQTRYDRRTKCRISNTVKTYNKIDMNKFFKDDVLDVIIDVHGETDDYQVRVVFDGVLEQIQKQLKDKTEEDFTFAVVMRALKNSFQSDDVKIFCSCLHEDTTIKLLDGTCPTVKELLQRFESGEKLYVYSVDENGDFKPGEVEKVWISGKSSKFIEIELDNGEKILTTPEHRYLLRSGEYTQASELNVGDSLMPIYFNYKNGYELYKPNSLKQGWKSIYKEVADYYKKDQILEAENRACPEDGMSYKVAIHHKDFKKTNNNPENLQVMTAKEHWDYHASLTFDSLPEETKEHIRQASRKHIQELNANPTEALIQARKEWNEKGRLRNYDEDRRAFQSELFRKTMIEWWENLPEEDYEEYRKMISDRSKKNWAEGRCYTERFKEAAKRRGEFLHTKEIEELTAQGVKRYWENISEEEKEKRIKNALEASKKGADKIRGTNFSDEHKRKISQARNSFSEEKKKEIAIRTNLSKIKKVLTKMVEQHLQFTEENYDMVRTSGTPRVTKYFNSIGDAVSYFQLNHRVVGIKSVETNSQPVYDIKVKDFKNFLVGAGVILHNCEDFNYRVGYFASVNDYIAGEKETRPSDVTNPDDKVHLCKHAILVLSNSSWVNKVASTIYNYFNYIKSHNQYQKQYEKLIFPKIFGLPYEEYQEEMEDSENIYGEYEDAESGEKKRGFTNKGTDTYNKSNQYAKDKTKFKDQQFRWMTKDEEEEYYKEHPEEKEDEG